MDNDFLKKYRFEFSDKALHRFSLLIKLNYDLMDCFYIIAKKHHFSMQRKRNYREIELTHGQLSKLHKKLVEIIKEMDEQHKTSMEELRNAAENLAPENSDSSEYGSVIIERQDVEYYLSLVASITNSNL